MKEKVGEFEREFLITPAFDRRNPDPHKNYGIHGVEMRWHLKGAEGVVQFVLYTSWMLDHVEEELFGDYSSPKYDHHSRALCKPMAADIGYHSPKPMFEGQEPMWPTKIKKDPTKEGLEAFDFEKIGDKAPVCPLLGVPCYYDGSGLYAEKVFTVLKAEGEEGLWKFLEGYYKDTFRKDKNNA